MSFVITWDASCPGEKVFAGHCLDPQTGVGTTVSEELSLVISWELACNKFHESFISSFIPNG